jgi:2-polyprenyl-6-methoxyphenol hydroxylase-like FAD-dependent oxidoreductase
MHYKLLGPSRLWVSELCLGTMSFGDAWGFGADEDSHRILSAFAEAGGNFVDTANAYHEGQSEEILGSFLGPGRDRWVVVATKSTLAMGDGDPNAAGNSHNNLRSSVGASLRRPPTDHRTCCGCSPGTTTTPGIEEVVAMTRQIGDRAVVLGAGIAGLLATRVLADSYGQVTVIDRDELPDTPMHRRGVPHGRHLHALAARGQQTLEELFGGLTGELVAHGAPAGNLLTDARLYLSGHRLRQADTGLVLLCASRPFLESHIRARLRAFPNVVFLDRRDIVGLATTPDGRRVTGARVLRRADGSAEELVGADLVVDATGRGSRTPVWLDALGYPQPDKEPVRIGLGYATRTYRLPPGALGGDLAVLQAATPQHPRFGALQRLEGDRWMLTLAGILGDHPPTDPNGFLAFARSLRFPDIYEAVRDAEPLDDPVGFRFPASVRHRYERLDRFPDGLLVLGDAVASFNPIYGQGMSVAAVEALALRRHLERGIEPQPRRWFRDLAHVVDVPWDMSAGGDLVFPGVPGRRTLKGRLLNAYLTRLHAAAAHDASLASAFIRVAGLVAPPQTLLRPQVAVRVLRASLHPAAGTPGHPQPLPSQRTAE